jgi:hypothetical protein
MIKALSIGPPSHITATAPFKSGCRPSITRESRKHPPRGKPSGAEAGNVPMFAGERSDRAAGRMPGNAERGAPGGPGIMPIPCWLRALHRSRRRATSIPGPPAGPSLFWAPRSREPSGLVPRWRGTGRPGTLRIGERRWNES